MLTPPRSRSRSSRCRPISRRRASDGSAPPDSSERWTSAYEQRGATPHRGPDAPGRGGVRPGIQVEGPEQRRAIDPGQEAGRTFAEVVGVERRPAVGQVQRDPACERLAVERAAGGDEGGHVGDRVVHAVAGAGAFGVERLIQVAACRAGRRSPGRGRGASSRAPAAPGGGWGPSRATRAASAITSASKPVGTARSCRTRAKSSASSAADAASRSGASVNVRRDAGERGPRCCRGRRDRARRGMPARPPRRRPR